MFASAPFLFRAKQPDGTTGYKAVDLVSALGGALSGTQGVFQDALCAGILGLAYEFRSDGEDMMPFLKSLQEW